MIDENERGIGLGTEFMTAFKKMVTGLNTDCIITYADQKAYNYFVSHNGFIPLNPQIEIKILNYYGY